MSSVLISMPIHVSNVHCISRYGSQICIHGLKYGAAFSGRFGSLPRIVEWPSILPTVSEHWTDGLRFAAMLNFRGNWNENESSFSAVWSRFSSNVWSELKGWSVYDRRVWLAVLADYTPLWYASCARLPTHAGSSEQRTTTLNWLYRDTTDRYGL